MNVSDKATSTIRTVVPAAVGFAAVQVGQWLTDAGVAVEPGTIDAAEVGVSALLVAAAVGIYYRAVRYVASRYPGIEWLLGSPKTPTYDRSGPPEPI